MLIMDNHQTAINTLKTSSSSNLVCPDGVKLLVDMFTSPAKKSKRQTISIIQQMCSYVEPEIKQEIVQKNLQKICKFINMYYLLCALEKNIFIPQCGHSVADKKVIKVIIMAYKVCHLDKFIKGSFWRGNHLQQFISYLKKLKNQKLIASLKAEEITNLDLEYLFSTEKIFSKYANLKNCYTNIPKKLNEFQMRQQEVRVLFESFVIRMYEFLGKFQTHQVKLQLIKLQLLYLNCILKITPSKIALQTPKSRISLVLKWQGYSILHLYFFDLTLNTIQIDKQYCKDLFINNDMQPILQVFNQESKSNIQKQDSTENIIK